MDTLQFRMKNGTQSHDGLDLPHDKYLNTSITLRTNKIIIINKRGKRDLGSTCKEW